MSDVSLTGGPASWKAVATVAAGMRQPGPTNANLGTLPARPPRRTTSGQKSNSPGRDGEPPATERTQRTI